MSDLHLGLVLLLVLAAFSSAETVDKSIVNLVPTERLLFGHKHYGHGKFIRGLFKKKLNLLGLSPRYGRSYYSSSYYGPSYIHKRGSKFYGSGFGLGTGISSGFVRDLGGTRVRFGDGYKNPRFGYFPLPYRTGRFPGWYTIVRWYGRLYFRVVCYDPYRRVYVRYFVLKHSRYYAFPRNPHFIYRLRKPPTRRHKPSPSPPPMRRPPHKLPPTFSEPPIGLPPHKPMKPPMEPHKKFRKPHKPDKRPPHKLPPTFSEPPIGLPPHKPMKPPMKPPVKRKCPKQCHFCKYVSDCQGKIWDDDIYCINNKCVGWPSNKTIYECFPRGVVPNHGSKSHVLCQKCRWAGQCKSGLCMNGSCRSTWRDGKKECYRTKHKKKKMPPPTRPPTPPPTRPPTPPPTRPPTPPPTRPPTPPPTRPPTPPPTKPPTPPPTKPPTPPPTKPPTPPPTKPPTPPPTRPPTKPPTPPPTKPPTPPPTKPPTPPPTKPPTPPPTKPPTPPPTKPPMPPPTKPPTPPPTMPPTKPGDDDDDVVVVDKPKVPKPPSPPQASKAPVPPPVKPPKAPKVPAPPKVVPPPKKPTDVGDDKKMKDKDGTDDDKKMKGKRCRYCEKKDDCQGDEFDKDIHCLNNKCVMSLKNKEVKKCFPGRVSAKMGKVKTCQECEHGWQCASGICIDEYCRAGWRYWQKKCKEKVD